MQSRRSDLDYTYFDKGAPKVQEIITEYFGHENIKFLEKLENIPESAERRNDVAAIFKTKIFGNFVVSFTYGKECFFFTQVFKGIPLGYRMKEGMANLNMSISTAGMMKTWDEYEHLSFHPSETNIKIMLGYLLDHLNYLMEEKEKNPQLTDYEISEMKICKREGWNYKWRFEQNFEKIEE